MILKQSFIFLKRITDHIYIYIYMLNLTLLHAKIDQTDPSTDMSLHD